MGVVLSGRTLALLPVLGAGLTILPAGPARGQGLCLSLKCCQGQAGEN